MRQRRTPLSSTVSEQHSQSSAAGVAATLGVGAHSSAGASVRAALHGTLAYGSAAVQGQEGGSAALGASASVLVNNLLGSVDGLSAQEKEARKNLFTSLVSGVANASGTNATLAHNAAQIEMENNAIWLLVPAAVSLYEAMAAGIVVTGAVATGVALHELNTKRANDAAQIDGENNLPGFTLPMVTADRPLQSSRIEQDKNAQIEVMPDQSEEHRVEPLITPNQFGEHTVGPLITPNQSGEYTVEPLITPNRLEEHILEPLITPINEMSGKFGNIMFSERAEKAESGTSSAQRFKFESVNYHGKYDNSVKSRGPVNGQDALDISVQVKPTSPRRIGIDYNTGDFIVFDNTENNVYHGHVRSWDHLHQDMKKALQKANMVSKNGSILRGGK